MEDGMEDDVNVESSCWTMDGCTDILLLIVGFYLVFRNYRLTPSSHVAGNRSLDDVKSLLSQVREAHISCRTELLALAELLKNDELANKVVLEDLSEQIQELSKRIEHTEITSEKRNKSDPVQEGGDKETIADALQTEKVSGPDEEETITKSITS